MLMQVKKHLYTDKNFVSGFLQVIKHLAVRVI